MFAEELHIMSKTTRDKVLELLESSRGNYLSGAEIASALGISRTAVWKAVKGLKKDGHIIDSVTNRGYCLSAESDILSESSIRKYIGEIMASGMAVPGIEMDVFDTVYSTNTVCLRHAAPGNPLRDHSIYAAIAGGQTQGRGRRGRSFFSPDGTGLYMSILLRPAGLTADQAVKYTTVAAVAVAEAAEAVSGRDASIKWVNDIYAGGRKVSGILTEASFNPEDGTLDYAVVGIGINVYEPQGGFPEDIRSRAGALTDAEHADKLIANGGRSRLAAEIIARFTGYLDSRLAPPSGTPDAPAHYAKEYRRRCFVIGQDVDVIKAGSDPVRAHVLDVDSECRLIVRYDNGTQEVLSSGEISIRV